MKISGWGVGSEEPQEELSVHELDEFDISSNVVVKDGAIIEGGASVHDRMKIIKSTGLSGVPPQILTLLDITAAMPLTNQQIKEDNFFLVQDMSAEKKEIASCPASS